ASMVQGLPSLQSVSQCAKHAPARSPWPRWACKAFSLIVMVWKLSGLPGGMWHIWTWALPAYAAEAVRANSANRVGSLKLLRFMCFSFLITASRQRRGGACLRPRPAMIAGGGKLHPFGKQAIEGVVYQHLSVRLDKAPGDGVYGNRISRVGGRIERVFAAGELAHFERAGDVVAAVAHRVQRDVHAADVEKRVVLVEHEGEDDSLEAVAAVLLPTSLLVGKIKERLERAGGEKGSVGLERPERRGAARFIHQIGPGAIPRETAGEQRGGRAAEQADEEQGANKRFHKESPLPRQGDRRDSVEAQKRGGYPL